MSKKPATPIIKTMPCKGTDPFSDYDLKPVRDSLIISKKYMLLKSILKLHDIKALVITPEYIESREEDTGKSIVFHILVGSRKGIGILEQARMTREIGDALDVEGFSVIVDPEYKPNGKFNFAFGSRNPFKKIFEEIETEAQKNSET